MKAEAENTSDPNEGTWGWVRWVSRITKFGQKQCILSTIRYICSSYMQALIFLGPLVSITDCSFLVGLEDRIDLLTHHIQGVTIPKAARNTDFYTNYFFKFSFYFSSFVF